MRETVARLRPDLLAMAIEVVGEDPFPRVGDGTVFAQPAIFCASLAGWEALERPLAEYTAGHSLGELGALVVAGVLDEHDALGLVALRGRLMERAGSTAGDGGMVALLGATAAERAAEVAAAHGLAIANDNAPQQVVLSGPRAALSGAVTTAEELGLRAKILPVTGAFHSPMMASAVPEFEAAVAKIAIQRPGATTPISAVSAAPFTDVRAQLVQALTGPVRFREVLLTLHERGVDRFIEVGPGRVLSGLVKRTLKDVELIRA
jgi:malonyl CoA-acyl carrier protein transacylase